jgi:hypothetical protein
MFSILRPSEPDHSAAIFEEGDQVLSETAIEGSAATDGLDTTGYAGRPSDLLTASPVRNRASNAATQGCCPLPQRGGTLGLRENDHRM